MFATRKRQARAGLIGRVGFLPIDYQHRIRNVRFRQGDIGAGVLRYRNIERKAGVGVLPRDGYITHRRGHDSPGELQPAEMRPDCNPPLARRRGSYAKNPRRHLDEWSPSPGVAPVASVPVLVEGVSFEVKMPALHLRETAIGLRLL